MRQIFYRLVGKFDFPKDKNAYGRLAEYLNRARRAGRIAWESIRDDSLTFDAAPGSATVPLPTIPSITELPST